MALNILHVDFLLLSLFVLDVAFLYFASSRHFSFSTTIGSISHSSSAVKPSILFSEERQEHCRNVISNVITISSSDFCSKNTNGNVVRTAFKWIEKSLFPHASLFNDSIGGKRYKTVVIPNGLCKRFQVKSKDITLTTHLTSNKFSRLIVLTKRWNGPASIAVKISSIDELQRFREEIRSNLVHLRQAAFHFYFESMREYPNNALRNLALDHVKSDYFALLDVDFFPSPLDTHQHLRTTIMHHLKMQSDLENRTIFIMPAFEVEGEMTKKKIPFKHPLYPNTRDTAIRMMNSAHGNQSIKIFHEDTYKPGHWSTNYTKWKSNLRDTSYPIKILEFGYEPYIVGALKDIPRFFEGFRGYGLNKLSFFVELYYANFRLKVLRDFFVFHLNHPNMNGDQMKNSYRMNLVCSKVFVKSLSQNYGAGSWSQEKEIPGWHVWEKLRDKYS
eukprot:CAMPEP_0181033832 /NCGR_PEP_ID=MMETSP1070-20121207/7465_1 /TAXON_ID=265543 /ORGANISM="Minutocellus polymorphus, Strain NH13" /LENGTH=443 /DNA_ID=CAMNT_0023111281 /DNA_START=113 /DNA_END=1444 /DNA_ORIENTATION=+